MALYEKFEMAVYSGLHAQTGARLTKRRVAEDPFRNAALGPRKGDPD